MAVKKALGAGSEPAWEEGRKTVAEARKAVGLLPAL